MQRMVGDRWNKQIFNGSNHRVSNDLYEVSGELHHGMHDGQPIDSHLIPFGGDTKNNHPRKVIA